MENTTPYSKSGRFGPYPRCFFKARPLKAWPFLVGLLAGGFTLVELVVAISIIVLLMALSVSSFRLVRGQAQVTVCQSNLRQLLTELATYESTNGRLPYSKIVYPRLGPPPGGYTDNAALDSLGWWWFHDLGHSTPRPHINPITSILYCPSNPISDRSLKYNCLFGNYGVNWSLCKGSDLVPLFKDFRGPPLRLSNLSQTSKLLLIVDSGYAQINWWHATADPPCPLGKNRSCETAYVPGLGINHGRDLLSGQKEDALEGRHLKKTVNVGYADGHVDREKAEALGVTKIEGGYANLHPLWVPKPPSGP